MPQITTNISRGNDFFKALIRCCTILLRVLDVPQSISTNNELFPFNIHLFRETPLKMLNLFMKTMCIILEFTRYNLNGNTLSESAENIREPWKLMQKSATEYE